MQLPLLMDISNEKRDLLEQVVLALSQLPGVEAVVLGGSYARGAQKPTSDLDIGIYYDDKAPFELGALQAIVDRFSTGEPSAATNFYGWGAWVNGGAWVHHTVCKVDFIYRNLNQVEETLRAAAEGKFSHDFAQQPPFGFFSVIYLAETSVCLPLYDPNGRIDRLKKLVTRYPPRLKERVTVDLLWLAEFTLIHAQGFADAGDVVNTVGCFTRVAAYLTQVLYAMNETYFISDKTAMKDINGFRLAPPNYTTRLAAILAAPGGSVAELKDSTLALRALWSQVASLTAGRYQPAFKV